MLCSLRALVQAKAHQDHLTYCTYRSYVIPPSASVTLLVKKKGLITYAICAIWAASLFVRLYRYLVPKSLPLCLTYHDLNAVVGTHRRTLHWCNLLYRNRGGLPGTNHTTLYAIGHLLVCVTLLESVVCDCFLQLEGLQALLGYYP